MTTTVNSERRSEIEMGKRIGELETEVALLRRVLDTKQHLTEVFQRYDANREQHEINAKLLGCSETNHVWVAVHSLLRQFIRMAHANARDPRLTNDGMRYCLGAETALEDFQNNLIEAWAIANKPANGS